MKTQQIKTMLREKILRYILLVSKKNKGLKAVTRLSSYGTENTSKLNSE